VEEHEFWYLIFALVAVYLVYLLVYKLSNQIPAANPNANGPKGIAGWLLILVVGLIVFGPLLSFAEIATNLNQTEKTYPILLINSNWVNYKTAVWIATVVGNAASIYAGYILACRRDSDAVSRTVIIMWLVLPTILLITVGALPSIYLNVDMSDKFNGKNVAIYLITTFAWTLYLEKSKRVKNTYYPVSEQSLVNTPNAPLKDQPELIKHLPKATPHQEPLIRGSANKMEDSESTESLKPHDADLNVTALDQAVTYITTVNKNPSVNNSTETQLSTLQIEAFKILLDYDENVKLVFSSVDGLPQKIRNQFLIEAVENPDKDMMELRNRVLLKSLGRPDLVWNEELETMMQSCNTALPEDVEELIRVFPILSKRMTPLKIVEKVFGLPNEEFNVVQAGGSSTVVIKRGNGKFLVKSSYGRWTFVSDKEVYEFLGTPKNRRNSLPSS
jgi:hypothetical protein